ncbi:aminoglycoside phosphotransferase family protein [Nocardioides alkalitolerans]|uniref:aminoglycoside phosphotransferase family protein n=1 Tax=Nocardioides alkalitolerans TaxID=281714 RepID=UPI000417E6BF|nr:aminoglycoside phosphotransferase family protein [Nocardioides alkalitolerans]
MPETDSHLVPELGVPGFGVLASDGALRRWLAAHAPAHRGRSDAERVRLRMKAGTSAVAAVRCGPELLLVQAYAGSARAKLAKTQRKARPGGVVAVDPERGVIAVRAEADRDLPALRPLAEDRLGPELLARVTGTRPMGPPTALSYNPQRRWVARLETTAGPVLLRAVRPGDLADALRGPRALAGSALAGRVPALLGLDDALGLAALSWVPGTPLDRAAAAPSLPEAGHLVAALHDLAPSARTATLPRRTTRDLRAAVRQAGEQLALLLPADADRIRRVVTACEVGLREAAGAAGDDVVLHGDLSRDQLVARGPGAPAGLLDLDRAARGPAADDLGCLLADDVASGRGPGAADAFLAGYADRRDLPPPAVLAAHTAAHLLRRTTDPFRTCHADWPDACRGLLSQVEALLAGGAVGAVGAATSGAAR